MAWVVAAVLSPAAPAPAASTAGQLKDDGRRAAASLETSAGPADHRQLSGMATALGRINLRSIQR
jgi:hypothetical protein